ncbi:MAG TPA: DUF6111 family protein [Xanthobacteraceae bacterium]|nr:DUF6111 family protein [Xanthobacteraceae bacterium]
MTRVLTEIALFLTPFVLYAAFLVATNAGVLHSKSWAPRRVASLLIVALILTIGSFVVLAQFAGAPPGSTYVPAHVDEHGKFVPGHTR